ncbi:MAG: hypothetical protein ACRDTT_10400, partial [Pseudonocardiaceae bacterium]
MIVCVTPRRDLHRPPGWYLTGHDTIHRSPSDDGEHTDLAYLGRLPRTDSKGTFLYLAGIHAPGTLGAATYLTENIEDAPATDVGSEDTGSGPSSASH